MPLECERERATAAADRRMILISVGLSVCLSVCLTVYLYLESGCYCWYCYGPLQQNTAHFDGYYT